MNNRVIKILVLSFILSVGILSAACTGSKPTGETSDSSSPTSSILDFTSDTQKAVNLVNEANTELMEVRKVFQSSQDEQDALYEAVGNKDLKKIKELCESLKNSINDGMQHAENAVLKLEATQKLDLNSDFREYVDLKEQALKKQIEAFKIRHELARLLRDRLDTTPNMQFTEIQKQLKDKEAKFTDIFSLASDLHDKANELARAKNKN